VDEFFDLIASLADDEWFWWFAPGFLIVTVILVEVGYYLGTGSWLG
jgi:hypothetical protein